MIFRLLKPIALALDGIFTLGSLGALYANGQGFYIPPIILLAILFGCVITSAYIVFHPRIQQG